MGGKTVETQVITVHSLLFGTPWEIRVGDIENVVSYAPYGVECITEIHANDKMQIYWVREIPEEVKEMMKNAL